jgi:hypothetical protein
MHIQADDSNALQAKVQAKKDREAAAARGEVLDEGPRKGGGLVKKKDGGKK